jgi:putative membrane protein
VRVAFAVRGTVLPRVLGRVVFVGALGTAAAVLHEHRGYKLPSLAHTLVGVALGLLLVFRTNASYDRWWEGRRLLGGMVNRTRDLARQVAGFAPGQKERVRSVQRHLVAFYMLGTQGLRGERNTGAVKDLLSAAEIARLEKVAARGPVALLLLTDSITALELDAPLRQLVDSNVTQLMDYLGSCERIVRTPVPFAYAQHIKLLVFLFCSTVPFVMVDAMRWATPGVSAILAFALFGIDEIGVEIEDPFGHDPNDLPIESVGDIIDESTSEIVG